MSYLYSYLTCHGRTPLLVNPLESLFGVVFNESFVGHGTFLLKHRLEMHSNSRYVPTDGRTDTHTIYMVLWHEQTHARKFKVSFR